jgi:hypothetical protein
LFCALQTNCLLSETYYNTWKCLVQSRCKQCFKFFFFKDYNPNIYTKRTIQSTKKTHSTKITNQLTTIPKLYKSCDIDFITGIMKY